MDSMRPDLYVKVLLTIIAGCLVALTFRNSSLIPQARAATSTTCTGEMKAITAGPLQASLGASYRIQVACN
jgi:hypothetical protein